MSINIEEAGNPRRKTKSDASGGDASGGETESRGSEGGGSSSGRKKRISVTPRDGEKLEEVADHFGVPKSKVYNMGFKALLEKFGLE
jgi:hypothetical protein